MNSLAQPTAGSQPVFTQEFIHSECVRFGIPANRTNYRRVRRAWDIFLNQRIVEHADGYFLVPSQTSDEIYRVHADSLDCTCHDSAVKQNHCKHAVSVQLKVEHEKDYNEWSDQLRDLMPSDIEQFQTAWYR